MIVAVVEQEQVTARSHAVTARYGGGFAIDGMLVVQNASLNVVVAINEIPVSLSPLHHNDG